MKKLKSKNMVRLQTGPLSDASVLEQRHKIDVIKFNAALGGAPDEIREHTKQRYAPVENPESAKGKKKKKKEVRKMTKQPNMLLIDSYVRSRDEVFFELSKLRFNDRVYYFNRLLDLYGIPFRSKTYAVSYTHLTLPTT